MSRDALKTLFHPFETGDIALPIVSARVLFLGAEPGFILPGGFPKTIHCVQGFRPNFLKLNASGHPVEPRTPEGVFDVVLVLCGRHRGQNEVWVAEAIERVRTGGLIVVAGSKEDGIVSLRKRLERSEDPLAKAIRREPTQGAIVELQDGRAETAKLYPLKEAVPIGGNLSKHHGVVFWFTRGLEAEAAASQLRSANPLRLVEGRFQTAPGMFSHDRIDPASRLLAENLPDDLSGKVADFCAGWGYLATVVAERCPSVRALDLYEADFESLEAAKQNLSRAQIETRFFWQDLLSESVGERYDAIVMNPPFHAGRAAEPQIGQGMIAAAAKALKKGGRLFMVANRRLPYEKTIAASFADCSELADDGSFKVLMARR